MQSFTVVCAKFHTILCKNISTVNSSFKIGVEIFSTKSYAHEKFGPREFKTIF